MAPTTCHYCGCIKSHTYSTEVLVKSLSPSDDIAAINEELARVDEQITHMLTKRASLLRRVNSIQSPIYSIPPEVLSHILKMAAIVNVSGEPKRLMPYIPLVLGAVSSYWRNVVHSTPRIWASIRVDGRGCSTTYRDKQIARLRYYLERASTLPLCVGFIDYSTFALSGPSIANVTSVMDVILQDNSTRLRALHLSNMPIASFAKSNIDDSKIYQQLEVLSISFKSISSGFTLPALPALQRLKLKRTPTIQFTTTSITCLHLQKIAFDHCLRLLFLCCDTLVEFQTRKTTPATAGWADNNKDIIYTLPQIKIFKWECAIPYVDWDPFFLSYLNMPQLRDLHLINFSPHQRINVPSSPVSVAMIVQLCFNWGKSDPYHEYERNGVEDLIRTLDVQHLAIAHTCWGRDIDDIIDALNPSYTRGIKCVPSLRHLSLPEYCPPLFRVESLVLMLEERLKSLDCNFSSDTHHTPFIIEVPHVLAKSGTEWGIFEGRKQALVDAGLLQDR